MANIYGSKLRAPTTASLPDAVRIPSTARSLIRSFSRLSRNGLINLALEWLQDSNQPLCAPYLSSNRSYGEEVEEDYAYQPSDTIEQLREIYTNHLEQKTTKRDVIDRILEGDWRSGVSLRQLAMLDFKCLEENESCLRWTALKMVEHSLKDGKEIDEELVMKKKHRSAFPAIHAASFIHNLQRDISPLVKAHYHLYRLQSHNLAILRLFISDSPYVNVAHSIQKTFTDTARTLFIAFPDGCPFIYISVSGAQVDASNPKEKKPSAAITDITSLKRLVLEAVPKALSRPQHRVGLQTTSLTARSLSAIQELRGSGRTNAANGVFSVFASGTVEESPLSVISKAMKSKDKSSEDEDQEIGTGTPKTRTSNLKRRRSPLSEKNITTTIASTDPTLMEEDRADFATEKKRKIEADVRFGTIGISSTTTSDKDRTTESTNTTVKGLDRLQIRLEEDLAFDTPDLTSLSTPKTTLNGPNTSTHSLPQPSNPAPITLTFTGSHIHAGLRILLEKGLIDAKRMPSWMTGEEGVSRGTVRDGELVDGMGGGA